MLAATESMMRLLLAILAAVLLTVPAFAQGGPTGAGRRGQGELAAEQQRRQQKAAEADRAYKAGLDRIPDANVKPDPWGNLRGDSSSNTGKTK
jgi:hypothetical protein